jgi:zinc protease
MRRPSCALYVLLLVALLGGGAAAAPPEALPQDPTLVHGQLQNGLRYLLKRHGNPEGRISLWLHVSSGSLNETEAQRGIAHYLEHMAFNGSKNFAPGSVVHFFQSLGLSFGRDQNAFTSFDQTTYQLALPDTREETVQKGLLFLSDVALRLSLLPAEIESERQVILEEKRTRAGARQRVQEVMLEQLAPGSLFGRRLPIGTEETILAVQEKDFRAYYGTWYVPSNMTVLAVGDCDMGPVAEAIRKAFADGPKAPRPKDQDVGVKPYTETRGIVVSDPELTGAEVAITRVEAPRGPTLTVDDFRRDLVEQMGTWIFNRRAEAALAAGGVAFLGANASIQESAGVLRTVDVTANGQPERWKDVLGDLARALQQARKFGFTEREVKDARKALQAQGEQQARAEATLPARALLFRMNAAVAANEPVLAGWQRRDLLARLLPQVTAEQVSQAFAAAFDPTHVAFVLQVPAGDGVPTEAALVAAGRAALAAEVEKPAESARAEALLAAPPEPGKIAEQGVDEASGVWSATFVNGVRAHHLKNDQQKNDVTVVITLAGGEIEEDAKNRGVTDAASLAWSDPATSTLSSTEIRDLMTGKRVRVGGGSQHDTLTLTVSGDPADLETGLQLAWLLLTDPRVEPAGLERWKTSRIQRIRGGRVRARNVMRDAMDETFYPGVASMQPLTEGDVERQDAAAATAWLRRLVARSPIEVAVVGDLDLGIARDLLLRYVGSLPVRARIGADTLEGLRKVERPKGPLQVRREVETQTPQAVVMDGFFGADRKDRADVRRLNLAARILSTRMIDVIREQKQLVYSIGAMSRPSDAYPGFGMFAAQAPTDPAKAEALGTALEEMYVAFEEGGPTEDELKTAKKQVANTLDEVMRTPGFWLEQLADLDYRGTRLADVLEMPAAYQAITAAEVRETFGRYHVPEARFRLEVVPAAVGAGVAPEGGDK